MNRSRPAVKSWAPRYATGLKGPQAPAREWVQARTLNRQCLGVNNGTRSLRDKNWCPSGGSVVGRAEVRPLCFQHCLAATQHNVGSRNVTADKSSDHIKVIDISHEVVGLDEDSDLQGVAFSSACTVARLKSISRLTVERPIARESSSPLAWAPTAGYNPP